jgi:xylulose-5-phosphate/fructose-6-phosphate phosphoketolase
MEILSEHTCQGWLEGYLLTGRHGLFSCYEAFIHIVDSMFNQHAKWLKVTQRDPLARPIASLNYPADLARLAPGPQRLLAPGSRASSIMWSTRRPTSSASTCRRTRTRCCRDRPLPAQRNFVNVIVAGKQPQAQWLDMDAGGQALHRRGIGIWEWASNDRGGEPDVVMACAGDVPTLETLAAVDLLRQHLPGTAVRVVNVVDLMTCSRRRSIRTGSRTATSTRCSPPTSRSSSPTTAIPG